MRCITAGAVVLAASLGHAATLEFVRDGATVRRLDEAALARACAPRTIEVEDPYYEARKRFRACPLAAVIEAGFGAPPARLESEDVVFRALDGYAKPSTLDIGFRRLASVRTP